jgi:hypothetical protein
MKKIMINEIIYKKYNYNIIIHSINILLLYIYNMNNIYDYYKKHAVWEDKGILLGLIYYFTINYIELIDKFISINNNFIRKILYKFFPKLTISNNLDKNEFIINIKSLCNNQDICINNVFNFPKNIECSYIYILPWCNYDNPLILVDNKNKKYNYDTTFIFNKIQLLKQKSKVSYNFSILLDDIDYNFYMKNRNLEKIILNTYINYFNVKRNYKYLRNYINKKILPVKYTKVSQEYIKSKKQIKYPIYNLGYNNIPILNNIYDKKLQDTNLSIKKTENIHECTHKCTHECTKDCTHIYKDIGNIITQMNNNYI